jgi:sulfur-carrier protein adenylyltransferase/sulfurtransferase
MTVDAVYPEDIAKLARELGEKNYALVDVRQPREYQDGHIPGARLIPLPDLETSLEELRRTPNLIFYCRSGARSMVAANSAVDQLGPSIRVANMVGGFLAWEGKELRTMPRLRVFEQPTSVADALLRAMDLEKGAQIFYLTAAIAAEKTAPDMTRTLRTLADVEQAHARVLHHRLTRIQGQARPDGQETFEQRYGALAGDILEGGLSLEEAVSRLNQADAAFCLELTELALEIELMAYDLYKNLAGTYPGTELESMFLELAQDEQAHQRLLIRLLPRCEA